MLDRTPAEHVAGRRILVTGAAGFIGFHVARRLLQEGAAVHGLDNLNAYYDTQLKSARLDQLSGRDFSFEKIDLVEGDRIKHAVEQFCPDVVIHLAAQAGVRNSLDSPEAYVASNITGFLSILEACRHHPVSHLIYASSSSVYGASDRLPFSEQDAADQPVSLYGATKRANELMAHAYAHLFAIPATALRFFTVYGPWGRPDMAYFKFTRAIMAGEPIDVFDAELLERDFTYIDDVVDAIVRLIGRPPGIGETAPRSDRARSAAPHRIYNVGNHRPVSIGRFIAVIEETVGLPARRRMLPMQPGDVRSTCADVTELCEAVGFAPRTPLKIGIRRFVEWYSSYYAIATAPPPITWLAPNDTGFSDGRDLGVD